MLESLNLEFIIGLKMVQRIELKKIISINKIIKKVYHHMHYIYRNTKRQGM